MIGVVVPACDEQDRLGACLDALAVAAAQVAEPVRILVVLDDCTDGTAAVCAAYGVQTLAVRCRDVGLARGRGVMALVAALLDDDEPLPDLWLAMTDADSEVRPDWLARQRAAGTDVVLGVVELADATDAFRALYGSHVGDHPHVHGASMGMSLRAYLRVGGFRSGRVGEDIDLAGRLDADPTVTVARCSDVRVLTSSRRSSRVRDGFADVLLALDRGEAPPVGVRG